jgi:hypothetical protein
VAEETVENTYSVAEKANITVRNADGRIQVYGWEENEIKITAFKRAFTKERLDAIEINVEIADDSALIDTIYPAVPEDRSRRTARARSSTSFSSRNTRRSRSWS